jgi:hypothetical protein
MKRRRTIWLALCLAWVVVGYLSYAWLRHHANARLIPIARGVTVAASLPGSQPVKVGLDPYFDRVNHPDSPLPGSTTSVTPDQR